MILLLIIIYTILSYILVIGGYGFRKGEYGGDQELESEDYLAMIFSPISIIILGMFSLFKFPYDLGEKLFNYLKKRKEEQSKGETNWQERMEND